MFQTLRNAWKIEDLRKKLLFTLLILVIVRLGCAIPVPFLDPSRLQEMLDSTQGNLLGYLNLLTGGAFAEATLFALGVSPYITASIVIQLLTVAIPSLERMAKEGPEGQKKIKKITRYSTIGLAILQAYAYYTLLRSSQFNAVKYTTGAAAWISGIAIVLAFSAGAMLVVWLGERIDEKGIGNGISLILFAGIVARIPTLITRLITYIQLGEFYPQYAKRIVGRKQYGGQNTYMPIKVNMSGVLPIIFASTFLAIPGTIVGFVDPNAEGGFAKFISNVFSTNTGNLFIKDGDDIIPAVAEPVIVDCRAGIPDDYKINSIESLLAWAKDETVRLTYTLDKSGKAEVIYVLDKGWVNTVSAAIDNDDLKGWTAKAEKDDQTNIGGMNTVEVTLSNSNVTLKEGAEYTVKYYRHTDYTTGNSAPETKTAKVVDGKLITPT